MSNLICPTWFFKNQVQINRGYVCSIEMIVLIFFRKGSLRLRTEQKACCWWKNRNWGGWSNYRGYSLCKFDRLMSGSLHFLFFVFGHFDQKQKKISCQHLGWKWQLIFQFLVKVIHQNEKWKMEWTQQKSCSILPYFRK